MRLVKCRCSSWSFGILRSLLSHLESFCSFCEKAPGNHLLLDQLVLIMSHTMKICNLLQSTQDVKYPTLASSQKTVYQDLSPTDRDTCPRRQEKIPETTATQGPPFIPATNPESIRSQTHQTLQIEQDYDSHEITPNQQKQSIRVRGTPVKAACLACRKRKSKVSVQLPPPLFARNQHS